MHRPTWITVVGIIGIILGAFGVLGGVQSVVLPQILDFQREMMAGMQEVTEQQQAKHPEQAPPEAVFKMFDRMFRTPSWFRTWSVVVGLLSVVVAGFYVFSAVWLLLMKRRAVALFYIAAGLAVFLGLLKIIISAATMSAMMIAMMAGSVFGVIINIILLIVVASSDKAVFRRAQGRHPPPLPG